MNIIINKRTLTVMILLTASPRAARADAAAAPATYLLLPRVFPTSLRAVRQCTSRSWLESAMSKDRNMGDTQRAAPAEGVYLLRASLLSLIAFTMVLRLEMPDLKLSKMDVSADESRPSDSVKAGAELNFLAGVKC